MISERQEKLLGFLIKEYLNKAEPVSSFDLKKCTGLTVSPATIRNDLQDLTEQGFITQPHTSAGRVPTQKAYKYFAKKLEEQKQKEFDDFIAEQIKFMHDDMKRQMQMMEELMETLENDNLFDILNILDKWHRNQML